jgi:prophage maintenance system killer protein
MAFLLKNGRELRVPEPELEQFFLELAAGNRSVDDVARWIGRNIGPI